MGRTPCLRQGSLVAVLVMVASAGMAADATLTVPKGTAVDLLLSEPLTSRTAVVGDAFHATLARALYVEGQPALAAGTEVLGVVDVVKSLNDGARSGFVGV